MPPLSKTIILKRQTMNKHNLHKMKNSSLFKFSPTFFLHQLGPSHLEIKYIIASNDGTLNLFSRC